MFFPNHSHTSREIFLRRTEHDASCIMHQSAYHLCTPISNASVHCRHDHRIGDIGKYWTAFRPRVVASLLAVRAVAITLSRSLDLHYLMFRSAFQRRVLCCVRNIRAHEGSPVPDASLHSWETFPTARSSPTPPHAPIHRATSNARSTLPASASASAPGASSHRRTHSRLTPSALAASHTNQRCAPPTNAIKTRTSHKADSLHQASRNPFKPSFLAMLTISRIFALATLVAAVAAQGPTCAVCPRDPGLEFIGSDGLPMYLVAESNSGPGTPTFCGCVS